MAKTAQSASKASKSIPHLTRARRTALLKALADPKRFELVSLIAKSCCAPSCAQVKSSLAIAPATLSHHIKELETAGLIRVERAGRFHLLHLQPQLFEALAAQFTALARPDCGQG